LLKRYRRFLADVRFPDGQTVTVHCPNSGSMKGCAEPGRPVLLSRSDNPRRRYPWTWELVHNGKCWIGINTLRANALVTEGILAGKVPELAGYGKLRREVVYGNHSRVDLLLGEDPELCYVEIKNVTLVEQGRYLFPDAVTKRGLKHLWELQEMVRRGFRAVIFFLVQRSDGGDFAPAAEIDPEYARALRQVTEGGVEMLVYGTVITPREITLGSRILPAPQWR